MTEKKGTTICVQPAYLLATQEVIAREFGSLEAIANSWPKYVVSLD
ncbi:MAG TPA: hypothetical protein PLW93_00100 [Candidatus Absconditabacterales bacterium]|nr:hypothetical protein [Candidatus Absconditabacterales bacterium]HNG96654.1 hypothetical protein [Candidatus Absconditabacterales bacterium]